MNTLSPMLAKVGSEPFDDDSYYFEYKYDGVRALFIADREAEKEEDQLKLIGRNGTNYLPQFPELWEGLGALKADKVILDGEILCLDKNGKSNFQGIQTRVHRKYDIEAGRKENPVFFFAFDLLQVGEQNLTSEGLRASALLRKQFIPKTLDQDGLMFISPHTENCGIETYEKAMTDGEEGIIAKYKGGLYYPGKRRNDWLKIKGTKEDTFRVVGYTKGTGKRENTFGALILSNLNQDFYVGCVGTGFDDSQLESLYKLFTVVPHREEPYFEVPYDIRKDAVWLSNPFKADIKYQSFTDDIMLRFPVFLRLRNE